MIPFSGAHHRLIRLKAALARLNSLPVGSRITLTRAAHLLGISDTRLRALVRRYGGSTALENNAVGVATLRSVLRKAYEARGHGSHSR
ncbi:MAG TPA: hypothetical protein VLA19_06475 [Herpetosiphonaceae bacterium]|nr:hypothetical protein [Herpetosiphonaceae bacterium]